MRLRTICLPPPSASWRSARPVPKGSALSPTDAFRKAQELQAAPLPQPKPAKRGGRELLELAQADLRRGHLRPHQRRDALLRGDRGARRLAEARRRSICSSPAPRARMSPSCAQRLAVTDDLPAEVADGDAYDTMLTEAVKRSRSRHGLPETGTVGPQTLEALNVPVGKRHPPARGLARPAARHGLHLRPALRGGEHSGRGRRSRRGRQGDAPLRHGGRQGRPSVADAHHQITAVNLNPTWTVPRSILKKDIVTKMRKDPGYVGAHEDARARRPATRSMRARSTGIRTARRTSRCGRIWATATRSARCASTCRTRIRSTCTTPTTRNFSPPTIASSPRAARASKACSILRRGSSKEKQGWSRKEIDAEIATAKRTTVRLARGVPVAWIYLTGWASPDGTINFRNDVYDLDAKPAVQLMVAGGSAGAGCRRRVPPASCCSRMTRAATFRPVSYLDSR